jgi:hypothetical protein
MAGYEKDGTFDEFVKEGATHGPEEERLSPLQIRQIIKKIEKEKHFSYSGCLKPLVNSEHLAELSPSLFIKLQLGRESIVYGYGT